jgi:hypothetical protein
MLSKQKLDKTKARVDVLDRRFVAQKLDMSYDSLTKKLNGFLNFRGTELVELETILENAKSKTAQER